MGVWENMRGVVARLPQKNDPFFILNWKICHGMFIRKFMLRHILL